MIQRALAALDKVVGAGLRLLAVLALPLALLLFLQWPLREVIQAYSRQANDLAQILFALYIGAAITYATRNRAHLAANVLTRHFSQRLRHRLERIASVLILLPWSAFVLLLAWPMLRQSLAQLEAFPETYNPGYFLVKAAVFLLLGLVFCQSLIVAFRRPPQDNS